MNLIDVEFWLQGDCLKRLPLPAVPLQKQAVIIDDQRYIVSTVEWHIKRGIGAACVHVWSVAAAECSCDTPAHVSGNFCGRCRKSMPGFAEQNMIYTKGA